MPSFSPADLQEFIQTQAGGLIGPNGIVGTSMIVFEFLNEDGKAGYSMIRSPGTPLVESLMTLDRAAKVLIEAYEDEQRDDYDFPEIP